MSSDLMQRLIQLNRLNEFDGHFGRLMGDLAGRPSFELELGAALLSNAVGEGDVCLDLRRWAGQTLAEGGARGGPIDCPPLARWIERLESSPVVGGPGDYRPLILDDGDRLYLHKYWHYEQSLVQAVLRRVEASIPPEDVHIDLLRNSLNRIFPDPITGDTDWQKMAALTAVFRKLTMVIGGPGTGKTFTVARTLAVLIEQQVDRSWRIGLAAPTGKAAARLSESIQAAKNDLACPRAVKDRIPDTALTLHRLLRPVRGTAAFRHNAGNPLPLDVLVIDEASMVDLPLMAKLTTALPDAAHLLLIGDPDQLASVESGSVLGDLCDRGRHHSYSRAFRRRVHQVVPDLLAGDGSGDGEDWQLADSIVRLTRSHRFAETGGIGDLSRAINQGDHRRLTHLLRRPDHRTVEWVPVDTAGELFRRLRPDIVRGYAAYARSTDPGEALAAFDRMQVLSPLNRGPFGVAALNRFIEESLTEAGLIRPEPWQDPVWYPKRPVMVTVNDYRLELFNGDVGVTRRAAAAPAADFAVVFPAAGGSTKTVAVHRLPRHETVYAMTVHKSQGSEFDAVHLILPAADSPVLTRELLYTAVTRAKEKVSIWGGEAALRKGIERRVGRTSGLKAALWDPPSTRHDEGH